MPVRAGDRVECAHSRESRVAGRGRGGASLVQYGLLQDLGVWHQQKCRPLPPHHLRSHGTGISKHLCLRTGLTAKEGTAIGSIARGKNTAELLSARLRGGIRVPTPPPSCLCAPCTHHHDVPGYRCLRRYGWLGLRRALRVVVQGPLQHLFRECVVFAKLSLPCELVPDK